MDFLKSSFFLRKTWSFLRSLLLFINAYTTLEVILINAYTNTPSTKKNMKINLTDLQNIILSGFSMLNYV